MSPPNTAPAPVASFITQRSGRLALVAALSVCASGCRDRGAELVAEDQSLAPLFDHLEQLPPVPVEAGVFDLVCLVEVQGSFDVELIPMWGNSGPAEVLARIEIGERRIVARGNTFRIPAVEVVPGQSALVFDVSDEDPRFDDHIGGFTVEIAEHWPARYDKHRFHALCDWMTPEREAALRRLPPPPPPSDARGEAPAAEPEPTETGPTP